MPTAVERLDFDSQLFDFNVGKVLLQQEDLLSPQYPTVQDSLRLAYSTGFRLVYLLAPIRHLCDGQITYSDATNGGETSGVSAIDDATSFSLNSLPGELMDIKTTYEAPLSSFDRAVLVTKAFTNPSCVVRSLFGSKQWQNGFAGFRETPNYSSIASLALLAGKQSRFFVDQKLPTELARKMYLAWLDNSLTKSVADEVFVAYSRDTDTPGEVGLITLRLSDGEVSIGLLAVSETCWRQGMATSLLCRAVLWAFEATQRMDAVLSVVTQGGNSSACKCYEMLGLKAVSTQEIKHIWLPENLPPPLSFSDQSSKIPFCKQHYTGNEVTNVRQALELGLDSSSHFALKCVASILRIVASPCVQRVLMVHSGTAALEMAAILCNISHGDEVIMPSFTFSSTANAVALRGGVPVFVDVRPDTLNIDERLIEAAITSRTKAVFAVHYAGVPCALDEISLICKRHNLLLVEDVAQGFLSKYKGRALGTIGDFGCFSFHYTKNIICGEGGALLVNSSGFVERALRIWEKGTNRHDFINGKVDKYQWIDVGSSFIASELSCAVLSAQLNQSLSITAQRVQNFYYYQQMLIPLEEQGLLQLPCIPEYCETNGHIFFILLPTSSIRMAVEKHFMERKISVFSHYLPLHSSPAGLKYGRVASGTELSITTSISSRLLRLPVWIDMTEEQLNSVVDSLKGILIFNK